MDQEISSRAAEQSTLDDNQVIAILGHDENGDTVQVEVLNQDELRGVLEQQGGNMLSDSKGVDNLVTITEDIQIEMETPDGSVQTITVPASNLSNSGTVSTVSNSKINGDNRKRRSSDRSNSLVSTPVKRNYGRPVSVASRLATIQYDTVDECNIVLSFHEWLGSVTERINQTMHYQFDGHPEPLVFHAPQVFHFSTVPSSLFVLRYFSNVFVKEYPWAQGKNDCRIQLLRLFVKMHCHWGPSQSIPGVLTMSYT